MIQNDDQNDSTNVENDTRLTVHLQETQDVWESCQGGHAAPYPAVHALTPHCMFEEVAWLCWAHWSHWPHCNSKMKIIHICKEIQLLGISLILISGTPDIETR